MITCPPAEHSLFIFFIVKHKCLVEKRWVREIVAINQYKSFGVRGITGGFVCRIASFNAIHPLSPRHHITNLNPKFFTLWFIIS